jgi:hypothetical protein
VKFRGDIRSDNVFDAYSCGLDFADLVVGSVSFAAWMRSWCVFIHTSRSCAISRRCCFAFALSFCCTIRSRDMESLSCTLSLFCVVLAAWMHRCGSQRTTSEAAGGMIAVFSEDCDGAYR